MSHPNNSPGIRNLQRLVESTDAVAEKRSAAPLPSETSVATAVGNLREILFPGSVGQLEKYAGKEQVRTLIRETQLLLGKIIGTALTTCGSSGEGMEIANALLHQLPDLRETLHTDAEAAVKGDPAALTVDNVTLNYPGFRAVTVQRIAHILDGYGVPLVPRQMTEYMHRETGIDIHPGATIGKGFFIDHGTNVVIGQTTEIGRDVRLYQGVTLGASTDPVKAGRTKRHPTLEDGVTCYANSGVFGPVTIGTNSVIGAGADVFTDIPANTLVLAPKPELTFRQKKV